MVALVRILSIGLTLLAFWCAGGAPSFVAAAQAERGASHAHAGHGVAAHAGHATDAHAMGAEAARDMDAEAQDGVPAPVAPSPAGRMHGDCTMAASHCAVLTPPSPALAGQVESGRMVHAPQPARTIRALAATADPPPPRA